MTTDRDFDRIAMAWLADGPEGLSDRVLDAVVDDIHVTPQRHALRLPWRFPSMTTPFRIGIAAVIGVLAVGGALYVLQPGSSSPGGAGPTPPPSTSPSPIPTPALLEIPLGGMVVPQAGRYVAADPFAVPVSISVPAGWVVAREGSEFVVVGPRMDQVEVTFQIFDNAYADPCQYDQNPTGTVLAPTVDALVNALTSLPTLDVTAPTDITVDGYRGKELTLTAPASYDGCTLSPDGFALWTIPDHSNRTIGPGERQRLWILDVAGQRLVILALESPGTTDEERTAVQAALDSIQIELPDPQPSPSVGP